MSDGRAGTGRSGLLRGRRQECEALDRLLAGVRAAESQVLVLRGEAGMGKSALLDYLQDNAEGCRVARAAGVESEMELAFAGLHQLCGPMLGSLAHLPEPQRAAIDTAFGLGTGDVPDRFLVGLALLGLLSEVAREQPLVCLVDDVQWLDRASAQALGFVARRLLAESVALVFVVREPNDTGEDVLADLPELVVQGLRNGDARALLDVAIPGRLDERVRDRIIAEVRGNPLALLELPRGLSAAELAGGFGRPDARPLASRIEQTFQRRLESLPTTTQTLLLTAASEPVGDVTLLWNAAERLGIGPDAAAPAEAAGLIELGARVRFRHPLVRAAAYRAATVPDRRNAHRVLAEVTDPEADPDRRAWHRAHAAARPDEDVATELERSAARAQARGGVAAAAAFLERATELTADPVLRGPRALAAAQAKLDAGSPDASSALVATAELCPLDGVDRARLVRLRAQIAFARRRGSDASPLMFEAAKSLEPLDGALARETYLDALGTEVFAGRLSRGPGLVAIAEAVRAAPPGSRPPSTVDLLLDGLACRFTDGYVAAVEPLRRALQALQAVRATEGTGGTGGTGGNGDGEGEGAGNLRWLWLACRIASELWEDGIWEELATRHVRVARATGALAVLPMALVYRSGTHLHAGQLTAAAALIDEAETISASIGGTPLRYTKVLLGAWRGQKAPMLALLDWGTENATARGEGRALTWGEYARAVLHNGLGEYDLALAAARAASEHDELGLVHWALVELVEAATRCDRPDVAAATLERLTERTRAAGTDWALGMEARSRALVSAGDEADDLYREAVERLARTHVTAHLARAHLVYGEWLRREQRRTEAREHLRVAHDMLGGFGMDGFAERARRELQATGETVRKRTVESPDVLTPQEAQVARLAADGHTNTEIGAQLYISPRTAEYHLHKVFTRLGITSRRQLRGALDRLDRPAP
jgi:DNA-binding CsgD family transcriptional regulator/tetratricopeptide (TPR) repeat protein